MAFNFNNETPPPSSDHRESTPKTPDATDAPAPELPGGTPSPALVRFRSCRWMQPAENGNAEFCTHREVKPYAGTAGFDAEAWCPECQYYKLRRTPKKRKPEDSYSY